MVFKYFLPVCSVSFHPLSRVFDRRKVLHFDEVHFINFFCYGSWILLLVPNLITLSDPGSQRMSPVFISKSWIVQDFMFRSSSRLS